MITGLHNSTSSNYHNTDQYQIVNNVSTAGGHLKRSRKKSKRSLNSDSAHQLPLRGHHTLNKLVMLQKLNKSGKQKSSSRKRATETSKSIKNLHQKEISLNHKMSNSQFSFQRQPVVAGENSEILPEDH